MAKISNILNGLQNFDSKQIKIGNVIDLYARQGFAVILFIMAIPLGLPIPAPPPLNFLFGMPLLFIALQIVLGFDKPYIPAWIRNKTISKALLEKAANTVQTWLKKIEHYTKPRLNFLMGSVGYWLLGFCAAIMSLSIFTIYPMSNTIPSFFIAVSCFGRITGDGLVMLIGLIGGLAWVSFLVFTAVWLGAELVRFL